MAVQNAGIFSILADETKDVSKQVQLVIVLRYVDMSTCTVHERFLTFVVAESLNAEGFSDYIIKTLKEHNLDPALIVSQGYDDGASVMSGSCSGVQQRIKIVAPNATYVHCYAHCLNLALVDCVRNVQGASDIFALMLTSSSVAIIESNSINCKIPTSPPCIRKPLQLTSLFSWMKLYLLFKVQCMCFTG